MLYGMTAVGSARVKKTLWTPVFAVPRDASTSHKRYSSCRYNERQLIEVTVVTVSYTHLTLPTKA